ncbi:hypothetical protein LguiB_031789 [Lonicera macranthoides]
MLPNLPGALVLCMIWGTDFIPQVSVQYKTYEDAFFKKIKDELLSAREHPAVAGGIVVTAALLLMRDLTQIGEARSASKSNIGSLSDYTRYKLLLPFCFENMWLKEKNFKELFKNWWDRLEKDAVLRHIGEIDKREESLGLIESEKEEGKRIARGRKSNKLINKLENSRGLLLHSEREIESEILGFFKRLYKENEGQKFRIESLEWAAIERRRGLLEEPFREEEVKGIRLRAGWVFYGGIASQKKGFGERWRRWIRGCLSSANFTIIINGKPWGHFGASRGLQQGDPLSPFLFILVVDVLSRLMKRSSECEMIRGFEVGQNKVEASHFQFADDSIFFVPNEDRLPNIALILGCASSEWPLNYLGLPLGGNPNSMTFWDPVMERVSRRIDGEGKRDHLVNWEEVSKSKLNEGLGVGNIIKRNMALLGKWLWRFPLERDSLWHAVIETLMELIQRVSLNQNYLDKRSWVAHSSGVFHDVGEYGQGYLRCLGLLVLFPRNGQFIELKWHFDKGRNKARILWRFVMLAASWGAQYGRAEKNVKELSLSVDLMKKERVKLLERASFAENEMKDGHAKLMSAGSQIQSLAKSVYKAEAKAADLMDALREIPGREALKLRAEVASMASVLRQERTGASKKIMKISELGVNV